MISNTEFPVAIEGNCSCNCPREAIASDSLADVSLKSCGSNLIRIGSVEMIIRGWTRPPVAIERNSSSHLSRVNKTRCAFWYVAMVAWLTWGCRAKFKDVCSVQVVIYSWVPISIKSGQSCTVTCTINRVLISKKGSCACNCIQWQTYQQLLYNSLPPRSVIFGKVHDMLTCSRAARTKTTLQYLMIMIQILGWLVLLIIETTSIDCN